MSTGQQTVGGLRGRANSFTQGNQAEELLAPDISDEQLPLNPLLKKPQIYLFFCVHTRVCGECACGGLGCWNAFLHASGQ